VLEPLFCYRISAKRYALFNRGKIDEVIIRKCSEHGLGHLLNPTDPKSDDRDWIREVWETLVSESLDIHVRYPSWLARPAISRLSITTSQQLQALTKRGRPLSYDRSIKPANFLLTAHVTPFGHPEGVDPTEFQLVAPYERDSRKWLRIRWTDVYSSKQFNIATGDTVSARIARVKSYTDVLADYRHHPESKSAALDGTPCSRSTVGLLNRRHVSCAELIYFARSRISSRTSRRESCTMFVKSSTNIRLTSYRSPSTSEPCLRLCQHRKSRERATLAVDQ
jgi:hypothetical protein